MSATGAVVIPDLIGSGLWGGVSALIANLWGPIVLALALTLAWAAIGLVVGLVRRGADDIRQMR